MSKTIPSRGTKMATLQVRSIDEKLYKALGKLAASENRSISQEVISILKKHLASPKHPRDNTADSFLNMCGTWEDDRPADKIVEEIQKTRNEEDRYRDIL